MNKVLIQYVGQKVDGETAFMDQTRIRWYPGNEHEVDAAVAAEMVKHTDVFAKVGSPEAAAAASQVERARQAAANRPWKDKAESLGLTDGNIEAIESHGGPTTPKGAELWKFYTGSDFAPVKPVSLATAKASAPAETAATSGTSSASESTPSTDTQTGATETAADPLAGIEGMDAPALHALAQKLGVKVHHAAGAKKVREALVAHQKATAKAKAKK